MFHTKPAAPTAESRLDTTLYLRFNLYMKEHNAGTSSWTDQVVAIRPRPATDFSTCFDHIHFHSPLGNGVDQAAFVEFYTAEGTPPGLDYGGVDTGTIMCSYCLNALLYVVKRTPGMEIWY